MAMRLPAEQRRRQLLDVACHVFAARGFHATSMDDVAVAAGVTKPVLYQHFPSKRALFVELLDDVGAQLLGELTAATGRAKTGRERVEVGFEAYFRFVVANTAAFRLLFGASARNDAEFSQVVERILGAASEAIADLIDIPGPPAQRRVLAHALIGIAEATSRDALSTGGDVDVDEIVHWVTELSWFGLRGVRADDPGAETVPDEALAVDS